MELAEYNKKAIEYYTTSMLVRDLDTERIIEREKEKVMIHITKLNLKLADKVIILSFKNRL